MGFDGGKDSVNKGEVRERLYDDLLSLGIPSGSVFGILAGRVPGIEVGAIRFRFHRPRIRAFDVDPVAVHAASVAGADEAIEGNVLHRTTVGDEGFDVFVLDLC